MNDSKLEVARTTANIIFSLLERRMPELAKKVKYMPFDDGYAVICAELGEDVIGGGPTINPLDCIYNVCVAISKKKEVA